MTVEREHERQRLRRERDRLNRQIAGLVAEGILTEHSENPSELERHRDEVERHRREFQTFRAHLEEFHRQYGALGDDD